MNENLSEQNRERLAIAREARNARIAANPNSIEALTASIRDIEDRNREARRLGRARYPRGSSIEIVAGGNVGVRYPKQTVTALITGEGKRYGIIHGVKAEFRVADGRKISAFYTYEEIDLRSIGIVP